MYKFIQPSTARITKISILKIGGTIKNFLWASRPWVSRRKEPIIGYVSKNYKKKKEFKQQRVINWVQSTAFSLQIGCSSNIGWQQSYSQEHLQPAWKMAS